MYLSWSAFENLLVDHRVKKLASGCDALFVFSRTRAYIDDIEPRVRIDPPCKGDRFGRGIRQDPFNMRQLWLEHASDLGPAIAW
jgi:hypothetical protein